MNSPIKESSECPLTQQVLSVSCEYVVDEEDVKKEEEEMKVTAAQKEKMEKDHDKIKEYYKVASRWGEVKSREY